MLVDDEPFVRQGLMALINWEKYDFEICCEADNGTDAFELAKVFNPELIITDIKMPEMDGLELIKKCKEDSNINSKYIILSGFSDFEYARTAMGYGVYNYILKPVDEEEVVDTLNKIKNELDIISKKTLNEVDNKEFTSKILKEFIDGKIEESRLAKVKKCIPEYEKGEFVYTILQPVNGQYSLDSYEKDTYEIITEIRKVILNINVNNMTLFVLQENIGLGIVVSKIMNDKDSFNSVLQIIADEILERVGIKVIIYMGKSVKGIAYIKDSRDFCMTAINTNFILSRKGIVCYEDIKDVVFNYSGESNKLFEDLIESVEKNNINKIDENIEAIYTNLQMKGVAPEIIKASIANFQLDVIKLITNMNGELKELASSIKILQLNFMVISDIKEELRSFCVLASEYMSKLKQTNKSGIIYEVKEYINANYNKDIKLKDISKHFYINTIYLGQIFKKNFEVSFNDYLNNFRVERAKELLDNKKYKICEISAMVGYKDEKYFITKFEKITGVTPAEYKKVL